MAQNIHCKPSYHSKNEEWGRSKDRLDQNRTETQWGQKQCLQLRIQYLGLSVSRAWMSVLLTFPEIWQVFFLLLWENTQSKAACGGNGLCSLQVTVSPLPGKVKPVNQDRDKTKTEAVTTKGYCLQVCYLWLPQEWYTPQGTDILHKHVF